jgi:hypothetical protein
MLTLSSHTKKGNPPGLPQPTRSRPMTPSYLHVLIRGDAQQLVDFALGGLNYQIEHHLFPSMPRPSLRRA